MSVGDGGGASGVLIVDDHQALAEALADTLRSHGFSPVEVATAYDHDSVVGAARRLAPATVLLDLYLGEANSLPMIEPLVSAGATVLLFTAAVDPRVLGRAVAFGAAGVVNKAVSLEELVATVKRARSGAAVMPAAEREALLAVARRLESDERRRREPFERLSDREAVVLRHLLAGRAPKDIARAEGVSVATVRSQIRTMFAKLGVNAEREAIALARSAEWG